MPLYKDFSDDQANILIWKFDENETLDFDELIELENHDKVKNYHPKKVKEVLMVRKMLQSIHRDYKILYKDNGEPYLSPQDYQISISHSFPYAALAISKQKVGIDLERKKDKIRLIRHKFILNEESFIDDHQEIDYLTAIWSAKEALYKIHHSKYWSLKKHYDIQCFSIQDHFIANAKVYDGQFSDAYQVEIRQLDDYYFSVVIE